LAGLDPLTDTISTLAALPGDWARRNSTPKLANRLNLRGLADGVMLHRGRPDRIGFGTCFAPVVRRHLLSDG
jgi:hypothetical protein